MNGDGGATTPNAHGPASPAGDARTVSGVLLASAGGGVDAGTLRELTTRTAAEQLAVRSAATADEPIGGRVLGAAGLVLLLALGAARELGTLSVRRSRPS